MTKGFYKVREIRDLKDMLAQSVELYGDRPAFEVKKKNGEHYEITYTKYAKHIDRLGTALIDMGYKGAKIAVGGDNCYEWCVSYMATVNGTGVVVPVDKELLFDDINNILNTADVKVFFCDEKIARKLRARENELKDDLIIVHMHKDPEEGILTLKDLLRRGKKLFAFGDKVGDVKLAFNFIADDDYCEIFFDFVSSLGKLSVNLLVAEEKLYVSSVEDVIDIVEKKFFVNGNNNAYTCYGCHIRKAPFIAIVAADSYFLTCVSHIGKRSADCFDFIIIACVGDFKNIIVFVFDFKSGFVCVKFRTLRDKVSQIADFSNVVKRLSQKSLPPCRKIIHILS